MQIQAVFNSLGHRILSRCKHFLNEVPSSSFGLYNNIKTYLSMSKDPTVGKNMDHKDMNSINTINIDIVSFNNHTKDEQEMVKEYKNAINMTTALQLALSSWIFIY